MSTRTKPRSYRAAAGATERVAPAAVSDLRPWFVYARKSRIGVGAYVTKENQWEACTAYVHGVAGPDVPIVYFFDNASGWDEEASRPDWQRMMRGLANGEAAGVVAWHVDRFTRQVSVGEELWQLCKSNGTQLHTKLGGQQTSALAFTVQNAVARDESDVKSERQKLKHGQLAKDGLPHGGRRAFGYTSRRDALIEEEATEVRWAAQQVLAGKSLRSICAEWAERGVTTVSGSKWTGGNLGTYLRQPMIAGLRVHHGEIVGEATWPPILEEGTWRAMRTLLDNPERRTSKAAARVYLLSGIARCGVCGGRMRGRSNAAKGQQAAYYCQSASKCAYRRVDMVDRQVIDMVVARLAQVDATGALAPVDDMTETAALEQRIETLEANLDALAGQALVGEISQRMLAAARAKAEETLAPLRERLATLNLAQHQQPVVLEGLAGMGDADALFNALDLERQRQVVATLCDVTIHPARGIQRGRHYDPTLVEVTWRQ